MSQKGHQCCTYLPLSSAYRASDFNCHFPKVNTNSNSCKTIYLHLVYMPLIHLFLYYGLSAVLGLKNQNSPSFLHLHLSPDEYSYFRVSVILPLTKGLYTGAQSERVLGSFLMVFSWPCALGVSLRLE